MRMTQVWEGVERPLALRLNRRCHTCGNLIATGSPTLFARLAKRTVYAAHLHCADVVVRDGQTMRQQFEAWARSA